MLDRVGSKYSCRHPSFILCNHILRSVNLLVLSSIDKPVQFIITLNSYLDRDGCLSISFTSSTPIPWYLGVPGTSNKFRRFHGREYPCDGLDRVQNPQGVLGSRAADFWVGRRLTWRRGYQTSTYHIRDNRIGYGIVCYPTGSRRALQPASEVGACY